MDLAGVDAPELSQPGGPQAKQFLTSLTLGKTVTVRLTSVADRLARLELSGVDVTAALIRAGMGWHCPRYADESDLANAEAEARGAKRGLWSVSRPTPPWLSRGAGACWQQTTKPRVSSQKLPNFSGTWTAVSPSDRAGQKLRITQDAVSVTLERMSGPNRAPVVYKLNGTTSRALATPSGPVDIVAKARWNGSALIVEERRWTAPGEEATNVDTCCGWTIAGSSISKYLRRSRSDSATRLRSCCRETGFPSLREMLRQEVVDLLPASIYEHLFFVVIDCRDARAGDLQR